MGPETIILLFNLLLLVFAIILGGIAIYQSLCFTQMDDKIDRIYGWLGLIFSVPLLIILIKFIVITYNSL